MTVIHVIISNDKDSPLDEKITTVWIANKRKDSKSIIFLCLDYLQNLFCDFVNCYRIIKLVLLSLHENYFTICINSYMSIVCINIFFFLKKRISRFIFLDLDITTRICPPKSKNFVLYLFNFAEEKNV